MLTKWMYLEELLTLNIQKGFNNAELGGDVL